MKRIFCLLTLLVMALLLTACNLATLKQYVPLPTPTPTEGVQRLAPTPTPFPTPRAEGASVSTGSNTTAKAVVCTGYPTGALNVRMCPGVQCWAFFVLDEGRVVTVDGVSEKADDGATWIHLIRPVDGWVNAKYLCEVEP